MGRLGKFNLRQTVSDLLRMLVNIGSVSGEEHGIMSLLEKEIKSWGVTTRRYRYEKKRFNLLARCGRGSAVICLNSHADTVPQSGNSAPHARTRNGVLYGLGACDAKSSIASMMAVFKSYAVQQERLNGTIDLLVSVDEERRSNGVRSVIEQGYRCDYAIVGEPTDFQIITCHMGQIVLAIRYRGKSTHSSSPWKGINAIDGLVKAINSLRPLVEGSCSFPGIGKQSMNLGAIHGGDVANRVPDSCEALIDIRTLPGRNTLDILGKITRTLERDRNVSYRIIKAVAGMKPHKNPAFIKLVGEEVRNVTGRTAKPMGARFWTEAADFRNLVNADAVVLGPGEIKVAHSENEYIKLNDVVKAIKIYSSIIRRIFEKKTR